MGIPDAPLSRNEIIRWLEAELKPIRIAGRLYAYHNGGYRPADLVISKLLLLHCLQSGNRWTKSLEADIQSAIFAIAREIETPTPGIINFKNGIFSMELGELVPHSPSFISLNRINASYEPSDDGSWDDFIRDVFPYDAVDLAYELIGYLMTPINFQVAIILIGEGSNGKSLFLEALVNFLGRENVANIGLHTLESDRFALSGLVGKIANICSDLPNTRLYKTDKFKQIVSGDPMACEFKYDKTYYEFQPYCRLVFSTNELPSASDQSEGWYRRFLIIPFTRYFANDPSAYRRIMSKLTSESAKSALAVKAVEALKRLINRGCFDLPQSCQNAMLSYRSLADPMAQWISESCSFIPEWITPVGSLYEDYKRFAGANDMLVRDNRVQFSRKLKRYAPGIQAVKIGHDRERAFQGIALKAEIEKLEEKRCSDQVS